MPPAPSSERGVIQRLIDQDPLAAERLDDLVHDQAEAMASGINNDGLAAQLAFLDQRGLDQAQILALLRDDPPDAAR